MTETGAARLSGLDGIKGLAIIAVVVIHAAPTDSPLYLDHVVNGAARLAVPAFLAVTGYLAGLRGWLRPRLAGYFWKFLRLHLIYGAFYWLLSAPWGADSVDLTLREALLRFGAGGYPGQYYFAILVQILFASAFLLPDRFWRKLWIVPASAAIAVAGTMLLAAAVEAPAPGTALALLARLRGNPVWLWFVYFSLGAALGAHSTRLPERIRRLGPALVALALGVAIASAGVPSAMSDAFAASFPYLRLPIFLGSLGLIFALPTLARAEMPRWLVALGRESFGVFVFNPALLTLLNAGFGPSDSFGNSWLHAGIATAGSYAIAKGLRRFAPWLLA